MKVKDLIKKLQEFDQELEVGITDGYTCTCYDTDKIEIKLYTEEMDTIVDIGIGGCSWTKP
jgi:hypothetical protein